MVMAIIMISVLMGIGACESPISKDDVDAQIPRVEEGANGSLSGQPLLETKTEGPDSGQ